MKRLLRIALVVLSACLARSVSAEEQAAEQKSAAPKHEGVWKPIAAVLGGARLPDAAVQAITLTVRGDTYEVVIEGESHADKGTYTIDATTEPKRMTIKSTEGPNRGKTFLAIYEMKDAVSMRVCYDLSGSEFPKEFKAPKDTPLYLVGYRRQPEQTDAKASPK
jgi:uncharacterized protein (TIGR03067 family)